MDYNQSKTATQAGHPATPKAINACEPPRDMRSLDDLVGNCVSYVQEIQAVRGQAAAIRERLAGGWSEAACNSQGPSDPGLLGALGQFQSQAWEALYELRSHLNAIQSSLG